MADRGMIFTAESVRALLAGRKTQTRRTLKEQRHAATPSFVGGRWQWFGASGAVLGDVLTPAAPGQRLWVREAWRSAKSLDRQSPKQIGAMCVDAGYRRPWAPVQYEAGGLSVDAFDPSKDFVVGKLRSPIHMPRWASRITLTVTDVHVQRLAEISEDDAAAEGIRRGHAGGPWGEEGLIEDYAALWNRIHGPGAWDANPWVAALTFTVDLRNIDAALTSHDAKGEG